MSPSVTVAVNEITFCVRALPPPSVHAPVIVLTVKETPTEVELSINVPNGTVNVPDAVANWKQKFSQVQLQVQPSPMHMQPGQLPQG